MKKFDEEEYEDTGSSVFLPCLIVFGALLIGNLFQAYSLVEQRNSIKEGQAQLIKIKENAKIAEARIERLVKDLVDLSKRNARAAKIVEDFQIKLNR